VLNPFEPPITTLILHPIIQIGMPLRIGVASVVERETGPFFRPIKKTVNYPMM
jgi:hypothetical protein